MSDPVAAVAAILRDDTDVTSYVGTDGVYEQSVPHEEAERDAPVISVLLQGESDHESNPRATRASMAVLAFAPPPGTHDDVVDTYNAAKTALRDGTGDYDGLRIHQVEISQGVGQDIEFDTNWLAIGMTVDVTYIG